MLDAILNLVLGSGAVVLAFVVRWDQDWWLHRWAQRILFAAGTSNVALGIVTLV